MKFEKLIYCIHGGKKYKISKRFKSLNENKTFNRTKIFKIHSKTFVVSRNFKNNKLIDLENMLIYMIKAYGNYALLNINLDL